MDRLWGTVLCSLTVHSLAPYEVMSAALAGEAVARSLEARGFAAPQVMWQRALAIEGCAVQFDHALRRTPLASGPPAALRHQLSHASARAIRQALTLPGQIAELSHVAQRCGIRIMLLKGAARFLGGEAVGGRSIADIDMLASPNDAQRLHAILQRDHGYKSMSASPEHHLPMLSRVGSVPVEIHVQLGPRVTNLDVRIWRDAIDVESDGATVAVPSPTAQVLHALEHGALVHWAVRYRLRDLLDVAALWTSRVNSDEIVAYLRAHPHRRALETLASAAARFGGAIPVIRRRAWRTVRRVARVRHLVAAHVRSPVLAASLCIAAGVLAEASPRAVMRPLELALFGLRQARVDPLALARHPGAA